MRLDLYLCEYKEVQSRTKAKMLIERNLVSINGLVATKCGKNVGDGDNVVIAQSEVFASRGGDKLKRALKAFNFSPEGKVFLDVGASNGGFTHCLLNYGAKKVYAIDIGENQLEDFLKNDERVVVMDKTNARYLERSSFSEEQLFVVSDLSFISLTLVLECLSKISSNLILLIKPQFECGKSALNKNGIVTDSKHHYMAVDKIRQCAKIYGLNLTNLTVGNYEKGKNTEFVCFLSKGIELDEQFIINLTKNPNNFYLPIE